MAELKILKAPNAFLRKKTKLVNEVTDAERALLADMAEAMYINSGVGLAANQIGIDKQLAVIDVGTGLIKLINPSIAKKEGVESQEEGCLSVPETYIRVKRAKKIVLDYINENGEISRLVADGLLARAIQHEIDHLSGKLILDYLNPIKRLLRRN